MKPSTTLMKALIAALDKQKRKPDPAKEVERMTIKMVNRAARPQEIARV